MSPQVNLQCSSNNETYQERLTRLEGDKESLVLQVRYFTQASKAFQHNSHSVNTMRRQLANMQNLTGSNRGTVVSLWTDRDVTLPRCSPGWHSCLSNAQWDGRRSHSYGTICGQVRGLVLFDILQSHDGGHHSEDLASISFRTVCVYCKLAILFVLI